MAILRNVFRVLGVSRKRSGLGCLTATGFAVAVSAGIGSVAFPSGALAGTCVDVGQIGDGSAGTATCGPFSIAIGSGSGSLAQNQSVAIGDASGATGQDSVALGRRANVTGNYGLAIGSDSDATQENAVAFGRLSQATGTGTTAVGNNSAASSDNATAIGFQSTATGLRSTALGFSASAEGTSSIAIGDGATAAQLNGSSIAIGPNAVANRTTGDATGTNGDSLALGNSAQATGQDSTAIGGQTIASGTNSVAVGGNNTTASGTNSTAMGVGAVGSADGTSVFGAGAAASAANATAIGVSSVASGANSFAGGNGATASGLDSIAIGRSSQSANGGIAVGAQAIAGNNAVVLGLSANGAGTNSVALGLGASAAQDDGVAFGRGAAANNANDVALGAGSVTDVAVATTSGTINGTIYNFAGSAPTSTVSIGAAGSERTLINLAAGRISADSTDAVNGSQLFATNQAVESLGTNVDNLGSSVAATFGGSSVYDPATGTVTGGFSYAGNSYGSVQNVFDQIDGAVNGGAGIKYFHANSTLADSNASGADSVAVGPASTAAGASSIAVGNGAAAAADTSVAIGAGATANDANSVALGAGSTTAPVVATTGATINGTHYDFAGGAPVGTVSVGSDGSERTVTNVAAGRLNASSTDAVNGSQLYATNQAIESLDAGVGDLQEFAVKYDRNPDGTKANKVTLQGGDPNAPVVLSNVGRGTAETDAVNVGQLNDGLGKNLEQSKLYTDERTNWAVDTANGYTDKVARTTLNQANAYTDQRLSQLNADIDGVRDEARQAAAIGLAAASLRYDDRPGKVSVAMGGGYWRDAGALAFGAGYTSESQRVRTNLMATTAGGHWGVGAGLSFTLN